MTWMLYGAYGYTGKLIVEEAVQRGHQPLLAGRDKAKLIELAGQYDLPYAAFSLDNTANIMQHLSGVELVMHAAGPYTFTAMPMQHACLQTGTHYLDVTGEIQVFEATFALDALARQAGIVMVSGVGYDVVPTDCLAVYLHSQLPDATHLEVGLHAGGGEMNASAGTLKSMLEIIKDGNMVRRNGVLTEIPLGGLSKQIPFRSKSYLATSFPWGDLSTAYRSTGIPNITAYIVLPRYLIRLVSLLGPVGPVLSTVKPIRRAAQWVIDRWRKGRTATLASQGQTQIYMKATNANDESVEAWLTTPEAYVFTAKSCVRYIEKVLAEKPVGALAPAELAGADFILTIEGCQRYDER